MHTKTDLSATAGGIVGTPATPGYSQTDAERVEANGLTAGANELLAELDQENRTDADIAADDRDREHQHAAVDAAAQAAEDAERAAYDDETIDAEAEQWDGRDDGTERHDTGRVAS